MTPNAPAEKADQSAPPRDTRPEAISARLLGILPRVRPMKPPRRTKPEASRPEVRS